MKIDGKHKVNQHGLTLVLVILIGFFIGIMIYILHQVTKENTPKAPVTEQEAITETETNEPNEDGMLGVLKEVDLTEKTIVVYDISNDQTVKLSYDGLTDFRDEYDQIITASQLILGKIVEMEYDVSNQVLQRLKDSADAWEYTNVTNLILDRSNKRAKLYGQKYKYTSKLYVRNADGESALLAIDEKDVLTVRGYDKTIYSIEITKGHGQIVIENCEYFEGGTLSIAGTEYSDIQSGMTVTVREGKVALTIKKDAVEESTTVEVKRNEETTVDLSVFQPNPEETGEVTFLISPFGAELFIDEEYTSYTDSVQLTYGEHTIEVRLSGYQTYEGSLNLNRPSDLVQIDLPETVKEETTNTDNDNASLGDTTESNSTSNTETVTGTTSSSPTPTKTPTATPTPSSGEKNEKEESNSVDTKHFVTVKAPVGVSVYVNGVFQGIAPVQIVKPLGVTYITLLKEGYEQMTHTVTIKDDGENKVYTFPALKLK